MGDVWPYGAPEYVTWQRCFDAMVDIGVDRGDANIFAAIAGAESRYDLHVVNDTPSTGDLSVGLWQINYYGNLYAERVAEFGTPGHLARLAVIGQARAAKRVWEQQGFPAWSTYNNNNYRVFLNNREPGGATPVRGLQDAIALPKPGKDTWSRQVRHTSGHLDGAWHTLDNYANAIHGLRG